MDKLSISCLLLDLYLLKCFKDGFFKVCLHTVKQAEHAVRICYNLVILGNIHLQL